MGETVRHQVQPGIQQRLLGREQFEVSGIARFVESFRSFDRALQFAALLLVNLQIALGRLDGITAKTVYAPDAAIRKEVAK